jgi:hypothetical protein
MSTVCRATPGTGRAELGDSLAIIRATVLSGVSGIKQVTELATPEDKQSDNAEP